MDTASNNKRIAKNTVTLYFRTLIVLFVSLYTSRMVLKALGAEDLGVYNVVGGIVALMSFIRASISSSTSRFITYELGNNSDIEKTRHVFSAAMTIHILMSLLVIILGETVGLYVFNYWTDIPESRRIAGMVVYQCALVMFCIHLVSSPYESVVIAHEKMSVFAFTSITNALLQLSLAYFLLSNNGDRLILYGILMTLISIIVFLCYFLYVRLKHPNYRFRLIWDSQYSSKMFSFSGWSLLGASTNAATQQGVSLLFNNFVGLIANAALGFANQVNAALQSFVGSFRFSFKPQIIKLYAQHEMAQMHLLMNRASKFSFMLAYVLALPLITNMDYVLHIWLSEVPQYTVEFCQLILVCTVIDSTTGVLNTGVTATGNIRNFQIGISISFLLDLGISAILLFFKITPFLVFGSRIITRGFMNLFIELYYVRKQLDFSIRRYSTSVVLPILIAIVLTVPLMFLTIIYLASWKRLISSCFLSIISCTLITCFVFMNSKERKTVYNYLKNTIRK